MPKLSYDLPCELQFNCLIKIYVATQSFTAKMKSTLTFVPSSITGVFTIISKKFIDERGYFSRLWCQKEASEQGVNVTFSQVSTSYNIKKGTVRGFHYQNFPHEEIKIIQCLSGSVYDVVVDVRPDSPTFGKWESFILSPNEKKSLFISQGIAHGYQTLENSSTLLYHISSPYVEAAARGIRFNDPFLNVPWPFDVSAISSRDGNLPLLKEIVI